MSCVRDSGPRAIVAASFWYAGTRVSANSKGTGRGGESRNPERGFNRAEGRTDEMDQMGRGGRGERGERGTEGKKVEQVGVRYRTVKNKAGRCMDMD